MAAPFPVTMPSSVQILMKSSSRRFDGKSRRLAVILNFIVLSLIDKRLIFERGKSRI